MSGLVHVAAVEVVGDHRLFLRFEDGAEGEIDLSGWPWRGIFEPLADPDFFCQVILNEELGTIMWPNGADVAPETLHTGWLAARDPLPRSDCHRPPTRNGQLAAARRLGKPSWSDRRNCLCPVLIARRRPSMPATRPGLPGR